MTTTSGSTTPIRVASAAEAERVYAVLALAFVADPASRWSWPDPHTYLTTFAKVARAFGGRAFEEGTAHVAGELAGAALWLPPGVRSDEETMGVLMAQTVPEASQADMFSVFEQMGAYHPTEPHWYLPMIGIDPVQQGRGIGSALLAHALAAVDRDHAVAYLESSNPKNVPLYERHGFKVIGEVQAGNSPTIHAMLRQTR